jgi:hypothetical protein
MNIKSFEKANWRTAATVNIVPAQRPLGESNNIPTLFASEIGDGIIRTIKERGRLKAMFL